MMGDGTAAIYLIHLATTAFMTGLIWYVQIVHYPLFRLVGVESFVSFVQTQARRTAWIVGPVMLAELATGLLLIFQHPPQFPAILLRVNLGFIGVIWLSTLLLQIPAHRRLHAERDSDTIRQLILSNWIRTASWTIRLSLLFLGLSFFR